MAEEEEKKEIKGVNVVQIPTQHELAYQLQDGKVLGTEEAIALILEKVISIDKKL